MERFWQATAAVIIAVLFGLSMQKQNKEIGIVLTVAVCCMVAGIAVSYISPVVSFIDQLETLSGENGELIQILLKASGISFVGQIATMICNDSGNSALGNVIQLLSTAVVLWMSLPLFEQLLELLQTVLGNI